jgi:hypothetical protein
VLGVSFKGILDKEGRREIVFQTHVDRDAPLDALHALADKVYAVIDRQIAKTELVECQERIEGATRRITMAQTTLEKLDDSSRKRYEESNKRGEWHPDKLPPQERSQRENTVVSIDRDTTEIKQMRERVAHLKKVVDGTAGAADRSTGVPDR